MTTTQIEKINTALFDYETYPQLFESFYLETLSETKSFQDARSETLAAFNSVQSVDIDSTERKIKKYINA